MKSVSEKVYDRIREERIVPTARWHFVVKNAAFWTLAIVTVFVGGLAVSTMIFLLDGYDDDVRHYFGMGRIAYMFEMLSFFWLVLLCVLAVSAVYMVRHTNRGYRYPLLFLFGGTVAASVALGSAAAAFGTGPQVDAFLLHHAPQYGIIVRHHADMWVRPEEGFLAGSVLETSDDHFTLQDLKKGSCWRVYKLEGSVVRGGVRIEEGELIKVIGEQGEEFVFYAKEIRPWTGKQRGMMFLPMEQGAQ